MLYFFHGNHDLFPRFSQTDRLFFPRPGRPQRPRVVRRPQGRIRGRGHGACPRLRAGHGRAAAAPDAGDPRSIPAPTARSSASTATPASAPTSRPYKTNLGILFWEGGGSRMDCPGYYFHLEPPTLMLGGGLYVFSRPLLERYRRAVADPEYGPELAAIVKKLIGAAGLHHRRRALQARAGRLRRRPGRRRACCATPASTPAWRSPFPPSCTPPALVDYCFDRFKPMEPLHRWLIKLVKGRVRAVRTVRSQEFEITSIEFKRCNKSQ